MRIYCEEHKIATPTGYCVKCKKEGQCPYYGRHCPC